MNLSPKFFKQIVLKLIGPNGVFKAFRADCKIIKRGEFNYETQKAPEQTKTIKMVNTKLVQQLKRNVIADENYIELVAVFEELPFELSVDDTTFIFEGVAYTFKSIDIDPAKAAITLTGSI